MTTCVIVSICISNYNSCHIPYISNVNSCQIPPLCIYSQGITERTMLRDMEGKELPAVDIFASSIRYLKEHFQSVLMNQTGNTYDSQIQYVLTVPAIWDDKAKIFMRKAAVKVMLNIEH